METRNVLFVCIHNRGLPIERLSGEAYGQRVPTILRFVLSASLCFSFVLAVLPAQAAAAPAIEKKTCCSMTKAKMEGTDCAKHPPKSDQEKQCCAGCVFCLATLAGVAAPFVYPPTGDEAFRDFVFRELVRSDRPQVPPPRFLAAS
jgi:hypothetical protein